MAVAGLTKPLMKHFDLGNDSGLLYCEKFLDKKQALEYLESLNRDLPWIRPTLSVYGRKCKQPRETCYVADEGLPTYKYSGYEPVVNNWDDFPVLKIISNAVHSALPNANFNSVLVNRYKHGDDYAGWHADDEKVYGPTPTIASVTLGVERDFLIRKKRNRKQETQKICFQGVQDPKLKTAFDVLKANSVQHMHKTKRKSLESCMPENESLEKPSKDSYTFQLKHGSLLVMQGYTQRDWEHSVPKRKKANGLRINLTFRYIVGDPH